MTLNLEQQPALWRWVTENGTSGEGTQEELSQLLASGELPGFALVWREGWGEWLPAMHVAELAPALPFTAAAGRRKPRPASRPGTIPPVPVCEYPRLRLLAKKAIGVAVDFDCPEREVITSQVPAAALLAAARAMNEPSPPANLGLDAALERHSPPPISGPAPPLVAEFGLEDLIDDEPKPPSWPQWLRAHGPWIGIALLLLGLLASVLVRWLLARPLPASLPGPTTPLPEVTARALLAPGSSSRNEPAAQACAPRGPALKLDDWAVPEVRPQLLALPGGTSAAFGYAQNHVRAIGARLHLAGPSFERQFAEQHDWQLVSVTPLGASGSLRFHVGHLGQAVAFGTALDTLPALRVGMSGSSLVAGLLDQRPEKLWDLPAGSTISVPQVAGHALGFTLAVRAGRRRGALALGLLSRTGAPLSALERAGDPDADHGRPALASGPEQTVLAVAARTGSGRADTLLLGRAPNGHLPLQLQPLDVFEGQSVELSALALAALPDGGFALMWSQGEGWRRQVRVQRLSPRLLPLGSPTDLSPPDPELGGATAGAVYSVADRLVAFYFARREEGHSLWVRVLDCAG